MPGGGRGPGFGGGPGFGRLGPPPPAQVLVLDGQGICGTLESEVTDETELLSEGAGEPEWLDGVEAVAEAMLSAESRRTGRAVGLVRAMV